MHSLTCTYRVGSRGRYTLLLRPVQQRAGPSQRILGLMHAPNICTTPPRRFPELLIGPQLTPALADLRPTNQERMRLQRAPAAKPP